MDDESPNLTHEILKQIRDETRGMRQELGHTNQKLGRTNERLDNVHAELKETNRRLTSLGAHTVRLTDAVTRHARIVDQTLEVSLEDSGRLDALEGRVSTLEAQLRALRESG